jgi:hypothetical protein
MKITAIAYLLKFLSRMKVKTHILASVPNVSRVTCASNTTRKKVGASNVTLVTLLFVLPQVHPELEECQEMTPNAWSAAHSKLTFITRIIHLSLRVTLGWDASSVIRS